jgi:outer membrane receptor protein involved in Fe transport
MERRGEYSIPEALRNIAGLRVQQQQGPGSLTTIQIRGLRSTDTSVLVDGFRLRDASDTQGSANPFLQDLLIVDTDRVEVLRGSGSSLYGTHALGGVVNIVTDAGGGKPHGELSAEGGGLGFLRGLARFGGGAAQNRLLYSGGFSHLNVVNGVDDEGAFMGPIARAPWGWVSAGTSIDVVGQAATRELAIWTSLDGHAWQRVAGDPAFRVGGAGQTATPVAMAAATIGDRVIIAGFADGGESTIWSNPPPDHP